METAPECNGSEKGAAEPPTVPSTPDVLDSLINLANRQPVAETQTNDQEPVGGSKRIAKIWNHHRHIMRLQNDLVMMASAAQLPKRARDEIEEELFGDIDDPDCSSSEESEEIISIDDTNTMGRVKCKPLDPPK